MDYIKIYILIIVFSPLIGSLIVGLTCRIIDKNMAHVITIFMMLISTIYSIKVLYIWSFNGDFSIEKSLYIWGKFDNISLEIGFLIDRLTAIMLFVVTFISLLVHIYTIGYMNDDDGYNRFFSYISFFTFSMLMLVVSNNFLQLFFGWEAVGLASYLLIGFWFKRDSAIFANLKAFLVNRVGDLGFLLGISAIFCCFGTLNYNIVFSNVDLFISNNNFFLTSFDKFGPFSSITFISICLFIGAMGKSAQVPLHVWLPDSMEGPTPISALIHAATMVTAGIFMVARMSPIFEYSETALIFILLIGTLTCFSMGVLGIVQNDIKRVVAYSTLSQLGLMVAGLGVSGYDASIFHLFTHAFFKALLFLGSGSVIIALHHEQDIRHMGNLKKYMPITYYSMLIGSLALAGFPGFSGFFSKDLIIEFVNKSSLPYSNLAYYILIISIFITSFYSFRMFFLVFHTNERFILHSNENEHDDNHKIHESPFVVTLPLIILSLFSIFIGWFFLDFILDGYFKTSLFIKNINIKYDIYNEILSSSHLFFHGLLSLPFFVSLSGIISAFYLYCFNQSLTLYFKNMFNVFYIILINKYGFDLFNQKILAVFVRNVGYLFWKIGDVLLIDKIIVNGIPMFIILFSSLLKKIQTGQIYNYVYIMVTGFALLTYFTLTVVG